MDVVLGECKERWGALGKACTKPPCTGAIVGVMSTMMAEHALRRDGNVLDECFSFRKYVCAESYDQESKFTEELRGKLKNNGTSYQGGELLNCQPKVLGSAVRRWPSGHDLPRAARGCI